MQVTGLAKQGLIVSMAVSLLACSEYNKPARKWENSLNDQNQNAVANPSSLPQSQSLLQSVDGFCSTLAETPSLTKQNVKTLLNALCSQHRTTLATMASVGTQNMTHIQSAVSQRDLAKSIALTELVNTQEGDSSHFIFVSAFNLTRAVASVGEKMFSLTNDEIEKLTGGVGLEGFQIKMLGDLTDSNPNFLRGASMQKTYEAEIAGIKTRSEYSAEVKSFRVKKDQTYAMVEYTTEEIPASGDIQEQTIVSLLADSAENASTFIVVIDITALNKGQHELAASLTRDSFRKGLVLPYVVAGKIK